MYKTVSRNKSDCKPDTYQFQYSDIRYNTNNTKFYSSNRSGTPPFHSNSNNRSRGSIRSFTAPFNPHSNINPPTCDSSSNKSYNSSKYDITISKYNNSASKYGNNDPSNNSNTTKYGNNDPSYNNNTTKYGNNGPSYNNNTPLSPQFKNSPAIHNNNFPLFANNRHDLIANSPSFMSNQKMSGIDPYTNRAYGCTDTSYKLDQMKPTPSCSSYDRKKQKRMGRGRGRPNKASVGRVQGNLYISCNQKRKTTGIVMTHPDEDRIKEEMRQNNSDIGNWDSGPVMIA